ncbi:uncharacterized protein L3040_001697 [Drepanopeziza brunnea f. sp. 'multigermtubi']|uniref:uncharacterized protein n=1 Tax=Drepanopeziza brunnea f. sp. 'multigermtubi' TaxID=698441 RepID=UPI0023A490D4|nr:hypothetical protein L3040_001697 [Drepanopeziza brunnea f. sp. 'multigermtubi']
MATNGERAPDALNKATWSVEAVVASIPGGAPPTHSTSPIPFFHILERLKTTKREGWRRFGISHLFSSNHKLTTNSNLPSRGESISDHMYRMSIMTMLAPASLTAKLNIPHCTKMALVHDIAEALVGDITPVDGVAKPEKSRRESTTMDYFTKSLLGRVNGGIPGEEMRAIWQEYEDSLTPESQFVHDVDKIELLLQMMEYERVHEHKLDLGEFAWVATKVVMPEVREWSDELLKERELFWGDRAHRHEHDRTDEVHPGRVEYYSKPEPKRS